MVMDPMQQPVKGLTKFALLRGVRDGLTVAWIGLTIGNLLGAYGKIGFWHEHISTLGILWCIVFGLQTVMTAEVQVLRKQLHLLQKRLAVTNSESSPAYNTGFGLFMLGEGVFLLLSRMFDISFYNGTTLFLEMFVWLGCCALFSWRFYRWRNRRAAHP